jgi:hypothetical protein
MRNNDGVLNNLGSLSKFLNLSISISEAVEKLGGYPHKTRRKENLEIMAPIDNYLKKVGYSGMEYAGYYCFFHDDDEKNRQRANYYAAMCSKEIVKDFMDFKKTRLQRMQISFNVALENIRMWEEMGMSVEQIIGNRQVQLGPWQLAETLCIYWHSLPKKFIDDIFFKLSVAIGEHYRISPEMVIVCPLLTEKIKQNEGENEYARQFFADFFR